MSLYSGSGLASGTVSEWLPWSGPAAVRIALAAVVLMDLVAFVIPRAALLQELWRETADLEERHRAATVLTAAEPMAPIPSARPGSPQVDPRALLPTISALAREAGMQVVALKQSAVDTDGPARRIQLQARGAFERIVAFIDRVSATIPGGRLEDITLRHLATTSQDDAGIELEYVLSVVSAGTAEAPSAKRPSE